MPIFKESPTRIGHTLAFSLPLAIAFALAWSGLQILSSGPAGTGEIRIQLASEKMSTVTLTKTWQNSEVGEVKVETTQTPGETLAELKTRHKAAIADALAEFPEN